MVAVTHPGERPVLITDVGESPEAEYNRRRRRYGAMMAGRVVCIIGAFVVGSIYHNIWLALICVAGAAVLPWAAVLIANDRLPKAERERMARDRRAATPGLTALPMTASTPHGPQDGAHDDDTTSRTPRVIEG
ncbi:DUF3099 domain-containing protein [Jatrophihabitans sp. YIM 134969]